MGGMQMNSNHQMMGMKNDNSELMNQMMDIVKGNPEMMQKMMGNLMDLCKSDTAQCEQMADVMSEHPHMMMMGMQKMKEKESGDMNTGKRMMHNTSDMHDYESHHMHK